ncbi:MAG: hypothetical protein U0694_17415 [Anaerolineae bacterium]
MKTLRYLSVVTLLLMLALVATQAHAECNEVSTNYWVCDGTFAAYTEIDFSAADEYIVFPAGTVFTGYAIDARDGNDTLINDGLFYGLLGGELESNGTDGNDTIINNGTIANCLTVPPCGSGIYGYGGNDTIINNGSVEGFFDGGFGGDTMVNRGTLFGNITGDEFPPQLFGLVNDNPNDTLTNSGTVTGYIDGDYGNDTITLEPGANGGSDNYLLIDGGDGEDTLVLAFDSAEVDAAVLANAANGTITIDGQTFEWINFEHIVKGQPADGRLNGSPADNARTAAVYCSPYDDGGVIVYGIDANNEGYLLFTVSADDAHDALEQAQANGEHVLIAEQDGQSLWALTSSELQIHDADGLYDFIFAPAICGIPPAS